MWSNICGFSNLTYLQGLQLTASQFIDQLFHVGIILCGVKFSKTRIIVTVKHPVNIMHFQCSPQLYRSTVFSPAIQKHSVLPSYIEAQCSPQLYRSAVFSLAIQKCSGFKRFNFILSSCYTVLEIDILGSLNTKKCSSTCILSTSIEVARSSHMCKCRIIRSWLHYFMQK